MTRLAAFMTKSADGYLCCTACPDYRILKGSLLSSYGCELEILCRYYDLAEKSDYMPEGLK
jgi:hypothetical protein